MRATLPVVHATASPNLHGASWAEQGLVLVVYTRASEDGACVVKDRRWTVLDRAFLQTLLCAILLFTREQVLPLECVINRVKHLLGITSPIELLRIALLGRALLRAEACCQRHLEYIIHVSDSDLATPTRRNRALLVFLQRHIIVFNCLRKVASFVFAGASSVSRINVVGVDLKHRGEIFNALLKLAKLLEGAAANVVSSGVLGVKLHKRDTVLYCLCETPFLKKARCANEQSLLVRWILLQLLRAN